MSTRGMSKRSGMVKVTTRRKVGTSSMEYGTRQAKPPVRCDICDAVMRVLQPCPDCPGLCSTCGGTGIVMKEQLQ